VIIVDPIMRGIFTTALCVENFVFLWQKPFGVNVTQVQLMINPLVGNVVIQQVFIVL